jgi:hypothetical protein
MGNANDGDLDPIATRALARAVARLLWEWAQAGRPATPSDAEGPGKGDQR